MTNTIGPRKSKVPAVTDATPAAAQSRKSAKTAPSPKRIPAPATVVKPVKPKAAEKDLKRPKIKLVRDGFTIPEDEYAQIAELKKRLLMQGIAAKKTEILRAALNYFAALSDAKVIQAIRQLPVIKAGRPGKTD